MALATQCVSVNPTVVLFADTRMSHHSTLARLIESTTTKEPDLQMLASSTIGNVLHHDSMAFQDSALSTTQESVHELWAFGAHEIISIAIVGVSVLTALFIAALYYTYKFCRCCHRCRKEEEISAPAVEDANNIEGIFVTRADWEKPKEPEIRPIPSNSSIKSFL